MKGNTIMVKKSLKVILAFILVTMMIVGCAGNNQPAAPQPDTSAGGGTEAPASSSTTDDPAPDGDVHLVMDFFPQSGGGQPGILEGWFAEEVKNRFNFSINFIVDPAGDQASLYLTRSAAGELGDFHVMNTIELENLVAVGLIDDITDLVESRMPFYTSQFPAAVNRAKNMIPGYEGRIFGVPNVASTQSPFTPTFDGVNPQMGSYMRQDVYMAIGAPPINTLDDLLPVLKQMVEHTPETESGAKTYGFTIWNEWDGNFLSHNTDLFGAMYKGIHRLNHLSQYIDPINKGWESFLDDEGIYKRALQLYFDANQMGLMDPDSPIQNWDTAWDKSVDGTFMFSWWSWFGVAGFNNDDRSAKGLGYAFIPITNQKIHAGGVNPSGDHGHYTISPRAKDQGRIIDFLNWIASPEGFQFMYAGPMGLGWDIINGEPVVTDWGKRAGVNTTGFTDEPVPPEFGGAIEPSFLIGSWPSASLILRWRAMEMNPETGFPYDPRLWPSTLAAGRTPLQEAWTDRFGYDSAGDYLISNNKMIVTPGFDFDLPSDPSDIEAIRTSAQPLINSASWRMIFASNQAEFDRIWDDMKSDVYGLEWAVVEEYDRSIIADYFAAWNAVYP